MKAFCIDEALKDFVEAGLAGIVGTASKDGWPHVVYGWGTRVEEDGSSVDVFLDVVRAERPLTNLRETGLIAVTLGDPVTYRSVQLKGSYLETGEPTAEDMGWVKNSREAFIVRTSLVGDDPALVRNFWFDDVVRVRFRVEQGFDQTPGPAAGQPL